MTAFRRYPWRDAGVCGKIHRHCHLWYARGSDSNMPGAALSGCRGADAAPARTVATAFCSSRSKKWFFTFSWGIPLSVSLRLPALPPSGGEPSTEITLPRPREGERVRALGIQSCGLFPARTGRLGPRSPWPKAKRSVQGGEGVLNSPSFREEPKNRPEHLLRPAF